MTPPLGRARLRRCQHTEEPSVELVFEVCGDAVASLRERVSHGRGEFKTSAPGRILDGLQMMPGQLVNGAQQVIGAVAPGRAGAPLPARDRRPQHRREALVDSSGSAAPGVGGLSHWWSAKDLSRAAVSSSATGMPWPPAMTVGSRVASLAMEAVA